MTLAITGATGHLGRRTAELLLDRVDPSEVVLVTRSPEKIADLSDRGADVRVGDFDAPETLSAAFAGVTRLLLVSTDMLAGRAAQQRRAIDAAREAGVAHLIYTSLPDPTAENPALPAESHRETEQAIAESGIAWTFLRNALYSEFRAPDAQAAAATGEFRHDFGDGRTAFVSREDCAAVAAAVLADGAAHENAAYDITGPQLLGGEELAAIYGRVGGRSVEAVALSTEQWSEGARQAGLPEGAIEMLVSFNQAVRENRLNQLTDVVQRLTGRAAVDVETVLAGAIAGA